MDFLSFKYFISIDVLIFFYYTGAIILPVGVWFLVFRLINKYNFLHTSFTKGKEIVWNLLNRKQQIQLVFFYVFLFLFMEVFWRMLFEFLIGYMQMRDALLQL
ncbi:MAG: DUF4282 domain-containing protein [Gammaproteobacteria bacterium]|nr:DUF4282 domain-containing protein [Gammaproteobacteria bacterium]